VNRTVMHMASLRTLVTASDGFLRALRSPTRYSPREVRLRLQPGGPLEGPRTAAVQVAAAQVGSLDAPAPTRRRERREILPDGYRSVAAQNGCDHETMKA
jgi:hypothetical protein